MEKIVGVADRVKTPLVLAGIVMGILYGIYQALLSLKVFENIGAGPTFLLLQDVVQYLFDLAIITVVLGIVAYLVQLVVNRQPSAASSRSGGVIMKGKSTVGGDVAGRDIDHAPASPPGPSGGKDQPGAGRSGGVDIEGEATVEGSVAGRDIRRKDDGKNERNKKVPNTRSSK